MVSWSREMSSSQGRLHWFHYSIILYKLYTWRDQISSMHIYNRYIYTSRLISVFKRWDILLVMCLILTFPPPCESLQLWYMSILLLETISLNFISWWAITIGQMLTFLKLIVAITFLHGYSQVWVHVIPYTVSIIVSLVFTVKNTTPWY